MLPGELRPALRGCETARESGSAPAPGITVLIRGTFRHDEATGQVIQTAVTDQADQDRRIELDQVELLRVQRDILAQRQRR